MLQRLIDGCFVQNVLVYGEHLYKHNLINISGVEKIVDNYFIGKNIKQKIRNSYVINGWRL